MRALLIGGGHAAYFVANAIREADVGGKLIIIEFTREKVEMLSKTFPFAEVIFQGIDEVEQYIRSNSVLLDAVIAATESDALNLKYSKTAITSSIPIVVAVLNNPLNREIFAKEGVKFIVNPYQLVPIKIKEILGSFSTNIIYEFSSNDLIFCAIKISSEDDLNRIRRNILKNDEMAYLYAAVDGTLNKELNKLEVGGTLYLVGRKGKVRRFLKEIGRSGR